MTFEFQRVDPHTVRDDVVNFFWEQQHGWPGETREDYYANWDWRYSSLSDGDPIVYVGRLAATGEMVGHIGVYRRTFRLGDVTLRVAVPGNLMVHPQWQNSVIGMRLLRFLRRLVQTGEMDAALSFGNAAAYDLCVRMGFTPLGVMHRYLDVRRAASVLGRRSAAAVPLAPLVDLMFYARRTFGALRYRGTRTPVDVRPLTADEFLRLDRSHWPAPDRLVSADSNAYIARRYLTAPRIRNVIPPTTRLFGLFARGAGALEAYVATEGMQRLRVLDCQANPAVLDPHAAIDAVLSSLTDTASALVPALPQSKLARDLVRAGYLHRPPDASADASDANTILSAYWLPDGPHAAMLADLSNWNIWVGSRHY